MTRTRASTFGLSAAIVLAAGTAYGWQDAAPPKPPEAKQEAPKTDAQPKAESKPEPRYDPAGRRVVEGEPTVLAFKNVTVEQILPFLAESTGKVVIPQQDILSRKITVFNDRPIPRAKALDLVVLALREGGIAVVENHETVALRDIAEIIKTNPMVIGPDESVLDRTDLGTICGKVFTLRNSTAESYADVLKDVKPEYAKVSIDKESNRITIYGDIAMLQRMERMIGHMDQPGLTATHTETFRLRFADAEQIAAQINDLFSTSSPRNSVRGNNQRNQQNQQFNPFGPRQQQQDQSSQSAQLKVSANTQQNSVTVVAEPTVLETIRHQIENFWDKELTPDKAQPKVYQLKNSDPVKVRALLEGLFGKGTGNTGTTGGGGGGQGNQGGGGGGQPTGTSSSPGAGPLAGQFSFQAIPDLGKIVVVAKSPDYFKVIDEIIADLDKVSDVGLPAIIELKHASAEDLAEQLNTLLAQDGTLASIKRAASGLESGAASVSPFSTTSNTSSTSTTSTDPNNTTATSANSISFWWQRSRPPTDKQLTSNLVGQIRIVPVWRQNALMVLAPVEYKNSVVQLISDLDRPGRQVLISAIIAEVSLEDATSLGLRWSSAALTPSKADNSISITNTSTNTKNDFLGGLFDTSVLNTNVNLNLVLQALAQKTGVTVLSEPKIFTSDNQEADFFSGQDIPFITQSQPNTQGNLVQSFDYKAVGIQLRVRPRITVQRDVDMAVNLQLSSIVQGQTLFGGAIIDRRETTTQLIVGDGQTIVISGILRSEDSDIVRKVPLLGDIPLLGWLFKSKERTKTNSEVLVFITPIVVDNPGEVSRVNQPYVDRLKQREDTVNKTNAKDKDKVGEEPSPPGSLQPPPKPVPSGS